MKFTMKNTEARKTVNIALIGCGFMGKEHAKAYALAPVSCPDIAATPVKKILCDMMPGVAETKAKLWDFEEFTTDYHEILNRDDIDIVDICTPAPSHADIAIDFLKAGKFVFCEKPLTLSREEGERLMAAVKEYHGRTAVGFNKRKWPAVEFAKQLIKEGAIGKVYLYNGRYHQDANDILTQRGPELSGGGFADSGSHILDMCRYILDDQYDSLVARAYQLAPDCGAKNDEETFMLVTAQMKSGVTASLYETYAYSGTGEDISFEVLGSKGSMRWSGANPSAFYIYRNDSEAGLNGVKTVLMGPEHPYGQAAPPLAGFGVGVADCMSFQAYEVINACVNGTAYSPSFEEALEVVKVCDAVRKSERDHTWVKVAD